MTPRCYYAVGKAFLEAGLPPGVLNVISCRPEDAAQVVNTIIEHPAVRKINFTGSAGTGRKVARTCGDNLKPCLMELGGKNSAIVLEDADLEKAAGECLAGAFLNVNIPQHDLTPSHDHLRHLLTLRRLARFVWVLIAFLPTAPLLQSSSKL
jgi:acyl-CoA reductase-like NAD-dependent aldehyde dehydrogenase